ncbi:MAG TPA: hypothetical protein VF707_16375 [Ardenticatenaceae bacterium]|jgi:hypothetical protein
MERLLVVQDEQLAELRDLVAREIIETKLNTERMNRLNLLDTGFFERRTAALKGLLRTIEEAQTELEVVP